MNRRTEPFDPQGHAERELERYSDTVRPIPPADFVDRVMADVEAAPPPRRGFAAALGGLPAGWHRPLQGVAMGLVLVLGVGGALAAGGLLGVLRDATGASPSPVPSISPLITGSPSPSVSPSPTPTDVPTPSPSPSVPPSRTPNPTEFVQPSLTPRPPETPRPTETPTPSDDHGGGGGSSGPGGGGSATPTPSG